MEGLSIKAAAASEPFRFFVGPDKREFTMHTSVIAHQFPALAALVSGNFKEAVDGSVEWDDIDELTFTSFWQFAYAGNYDVPDELLMQSDVSYVGGDPEPDVVEHPTFEEEVWGFRCSSVKKRKTTGRRQTAWSDFQSIWKVATYRYGIPRLMALSFQKLYQGLVKYPISEDNIGTTVAVLRFCCSELVPDKLKHLLAHHYAACNIKTLWKRE